MNKFIKYILLLIFIIPTNLFSQNIGNEWINLNQSYYRFSIAKTGLYKITNAELQAAGIPVGNFSPQNIQLFQNGIEIACYIEGESQGLIEYILFYAKKNDGWFDIEMYDNPINQTNANYSLITDTAAVFFTWNTEFNNLRYSVESDINFTGYTPELYCWANSFVEFTNTNYTALEDCEYVEAEGWFDDQVLNLGGSFTKTLLTPDFYNAGLISKLNLAFITFSKDAGSINNTHHIQVSGPGFSTDTIFSGYKSINLNENVNSLSENTEIIFKSIDDQGALSSKAAVSYINLEYTRGFNANKSLFFKFSLPASATKKSYVEIIDFVSEGNPYLFDLTNSKIIPVVKEGNLHKSLISESNQITDLLLIDENYFFSPESITVSNMANHSAKNKKYIIISHPKLWESAIAYANYRDAYLVDIDELYNQFGYGIQQHPIAIRNFLKYIYQNWSVKPNNVFIIGKGIESIYTRKNPIVYSNCLIPTMGYPGSDALLSNRISGSGYESAFATGRLAAQSNTDVYIYLNKVQEFEQNKANEWMKRAIHFGGGKDASEQARFKNYLKNYENIFVDTLYGGNVTTFLKTSSDPIVISKSDSIKGLVNNGVSLMSFFGHGDAANGFDQNIDEPSTYNNSKKYPFMLANSCYTGNIHLNGKTSQSEEWVIIPDKGAIGFLAVVGSGIASYLNIFSEQVYKNLSVNKYGESLGIIINDARKHLLEVSPNSRIAKYTAHEFTLHGDPAIVLNSFLLPDLTINSYDVTFTPQKITTEIDSFYINFIATNQAKTVNKSFTIDVDRYYPTGISSNNYIEAKGLYYKDTFKIKLPVDKINGLGNNKFSIHIDANNAIEELDKLNNSVDVNIFITSADIVPVFPYKYGINPTNNITLKTSSVDAFANYQTTTFQIDTSYLFNSGELYSENITHSGGIVEWTPQLSWNANQVYYWRVAKNIEEKKWAQSSFVLNDNKLGWQQSDYGQIKDNNLRFLEKADSKREFEFTTAPKTLVCKNMGTPWGETEWRSVGYGIEGIGASSSCGAYNAMILAIIDSLTLLPWQSDYGEEGEIGHGNDPWCENKTQPQNYFIFYSNNTDNIQNMVDFVDNEVEDGHYILIYSFMNGNFENFNESTRSKFESWGANNIRFINNNIPYIFFAKKGDLNSAEEVIGATTESEIELYKNLKGNFTYGSITSSKIGPSLGWQTLNWNSYSIDDNNLEEISFLKVYGINNSDQEILLIDSVTSPSIDLTEFNAVTYPYLKLLFYTKDEALRTPSQLDYWEVLYNPVTDLALNPQKGFSFNSDTLHQGEKGFMSVTFENIGSSEVDSTVVNYWVQDQNNKTYAVSKHNIAPLKPGEFFTDSVEFSTLLYKGNHSLWVELNPANTTTRAANYREQYYFNNLAQIPFYVQPDVSNPLLDVTFDGLHIMDGDIISAAPEIVIQLKDENKFIALDDTSVFSLYIKSQASGTEKKIAISNNSEVTFIPATLPENKAQIIYRTQFADDGIYELRVQAKDLSSNESGFFDYVISFQVINESTITNVFNYPNPFSTSTRFVFELTGSAIPDHMRIEILTVSGKLVKVIYLEDLGPITIGKNITEYIWDGTDMYSDPLANGVYFYRVNATLNGEEIKIRDTGTNQYFKNGFGKMYLMR